MAEGRTSNARLDPAPVRPSPVADVSRADEIDLLAYTEVWWRKRYVLLAVILVVGVITYAINRALEPTYEVTFRLMASDPGVTENATSRVSMAAFRELVESPTLVSALLTEFKLDAEPYRLTPQRFLEGHISVDLIRESTILVVAVRLKDRDLLVKVANRYAESVVRLAQRLNTEDIDHTAERIRRQRDAAYKNLQGVEHKLRDFHQTTQIEVLRSDMDTMLDRRPDIIDLGVQIEGERARLRQSEAELAKQEQIRTVRRGIDAVGAGRPAEDPARPPRELGIRSELLDPYVNPVYEALTRDVAESRARLASLENQRRQLVSSLGVDAASTQRLTRLYEAESQLETLMRDLEIGRAAYVSAAEKYEDARLQSALRSPRLQILDAALPPDRPVAPRAARNTLTMMLLALTIAAIVVVARDPTRRSL